MNILRFLKSASRKLDLLKHLKFQQKLLLSYSIIIVTFLLIVGYGIYYYSAYTIRNEVLNYVKISAQQINKNIDAYINELFRLSSMTFSDEELQKILKNTGKAKSVTEQLRDNSYILSFLFNIYILRPDLYSVYLITNNGEIYLEGYSRYINNSYDVKKENWYARLEENPKSMLIVGPRNSAQALRIIDEKLVFTIVRKIISSDGQSLGTIILDTNYETFRNIFIPLETEQKAQIVLLNDKRELVYNSKSYEKKNNDWIDDFRNNYKIDKDGGQFVGININNEKVLAIVDKSAYTDWDIVMAIPESQILKKINSVRDFIIVLILISIGVLIFLYFFVSSAVVMPVKKLTGLMKKVENGDFSVSMSIESDDEIGELSKGFNNMISKINLLLKKTIEFEVRNKESEFKALQSQINPHFLYNTLESIRMKCIVKKEVEIAEVINTLGNLFRLSIDRGEILVSVKDELEHVLSYMTIQNFRYDNKYKLIIDMDDDLADYKVFKLMLQPLVENSIYHGLEMKPDDGYIIIKIYLLENELNILIEDNGLGMNEKTYNALVNALSENSKPMDKRSVGLSNVNERIKLFFGNEYGINIWSRENEGTKIEIKMPAFKDKSEVKLFV